MVGDSLRGSVALEFQKNRTELKSRAYSAPVVDLAFRPNANPERYRSFGDHISMFDTSAQTALYTNELFSQRPLTHQYQQTRQQIKPD